MNDFKNMLILADITTVDQLSERLLEINEQIQAMQALADSETRDLTEEEAGNMDQFFTEFGRLEAEIERRNKIESQTAKLVESVGRKTDPNVPDDGIVRNQEPVNVNPKPQPRGVTIIRTPDEARRHGFRSLGEFAIAAKLASRQGGYVDPRLVSNAPSTVSTEGTGADGGFAVPPDFRTAIMEKVMAEESLLSRTDQLVTSGNSIVLPKDETTPWQTSGGIQAYWDGEGDQLTQSKVALQEETIRLNKLTALVPVTEELMEDAPSLDSYLRKKVPEKFDFKINLAMVKGTGAGQPTGILTAGCLVGVDKESGQAADTIVFENIINMWARMYGPCRSKSVWLINQDIEPQLFTMSFEGTSSSVPAYLPANGLSASPYGTLMGRPVMPTQACETLGDKGDIILADFSQYLSAVKTGGVRSETSIHLWFDYDVTAYRFIMRLAGQPWWTAAIDPRDGTNTLSPFVTLNERA